MAERQQNVCIKQEIFFEQSGINNQTSPFVINTKVEDCEVKTEFDEDNQDQEVIDQYLPWKHESIKNEPRDLEPTLIHYDTSQILKTEIEIEEESVIQTQIQNGQNTKSQLPTNKRINSSRATKERCKNGTRTTINSKSKPKKASVHTYTCTFCLKKYCTDFGLIEHERRHHSDRLPFECRVCRKRFNEIGEMNGHESDCKRRRFECYLCRFSSLHSRLDRFLVHFRQHTGEKPFNCKCCAKKFSSKRMLNHHMKYHPTEITSKCLFCQRNFPNGAEKKVHESQCSLKRQLECYLCKSTFTFRSSLRRHMPQHTGLTQFNCKHCSKGYARREFYELHLQKKHINELQFQCTICDMKFSQQSDADKHMQSCKKKTELKCNLCNYKTVSMIYFEDHKQKHIGSDEFKCLHCDKVFLQRSKLVHHVKSHNQKLKFNCPHCTKVYHRWLFMEKHQQICPNAPSNRTTTNS